MKVNMLSFFFLTSTMLARMAAFAIQSLLIVDRSASEADIKKAYKRLSRKYHPDRNKEPGAEEKFVEITQGRWRRLHSAALAHLFFLRSSLRGIIRPKGRHDLCTLMLMRVLIIVITLHCRKNKYMIVTEKMDSKPMKVAKVPIHSTYFQISLVTVNVPSQFVEDPPWFPNLKSSSRTYIQATVSIS
jgi:hypothetical protein